MLLYGTSTDQEVSKRGWTIAVPWRRRVSPKIHHTPMLSTWFYMLTVYILEPRHLSHLAELLSWLNYSKSKESKGTWTSLPDASRISWISMKPAMQPFIATQHINAFTFSTGQSQGTLARGELVHLIDWRPSRTRHRNFPCSVSFCPSRSWTVHADVEIHASTASDSGRQLEVRLNEAKTRPQEHTHLIQQPTRLNLWLQVTQLQSTVIPWHRRKRRPGRFKGCRLWVNWWPKVKFRRQLGNATSSKPAWHRGEPRSLVRKTACCCSTKGHVKDTWIYEWNWMNIFGARGRN